MKSLFNQDETDLQLVFETFSRNREVDLSVYQPFLQQGEFQTVVELGAGIGRLTEVWLSMGFKVIAIEQECQLRTILLKRFYSFIETEQLVIVSSLEQLDQKIENAILLAPFNVAFYFANPVDFLDTCYLIFKKGVKTMLFDLDIVNESDWKYDPNYEQITRYFNEFQEIISIKNQRKIEVNWQNNYSQKSIIKFQLKFHLWQEICSIIEQIIPNSHSQIIAKRKDTLSGSEIIFIEVSLF